MCGADASRWEAANMVWMVAAVRKLWKEYDTGVSCPVNRHSLKPLR